MNTGECAAQTRPCLQSCSGFRRLEAGAVPFAEAWARHWPPDCAEVYSEGAYRAAETLVIPQGFETIGIT